jgi:DNA polymerase-1
MRLAVIDCDPLLWAAAYMNKDMNNDHVMLQTLDHMFTNILINTKADEYVGFLQGADPSHRHKMFADYKGTRPPKPDWFRVSEQSLKDQLHHHWKCEYAMGQETDDCIASVVEKYKGTDTVTIVCSIDKDFNQLEGEIYNPRKNETITVTEFEAEYNLAKQILMGDRVDNIQGLPGIGPKKAQDYLEVLYHPSLHYKSP